MKLRLWAVVDIETDRQGNVLAIGLAYRESGKIIYHELPHWGDFLRQIEQRKIARVYAHNGGGFDYLSLLSVIPDCWSWDGSVVNGKLISMALTRGEYSCRLMDSYRIAPVGLDKLATSLLARGKTEDAQSDHPEDLYLQFPQRFSDYLKTDCELLLECLEKMTGLYKEISPRFGSLGVTCGSTAKKLWDSMQHPRYVRPQREQLNAVLRAGYRGGRCECLRPGDYTGVSSYDVNSMYPYAMCKAVVPVSGRVLQSREYRGRPGIWLVQFHQKSGDVPLFLVNGDGQFHGRGWYYAPEIEAALEYGIKLDFLDGFEFLDYTDSLFSDFIRPLWELRERYGSQSAMGLVSKLSMNNLYGKMGQGDEIDTIFTCSDVDKLVCRRATPIDLERDIYSGTEDKICEHQHYGIAGTITSYSRAYLFRLMVGNSPIYCDTDSIHVSGSMKISTGLGGLKLEKTADRAVYAGKKLYGMAGNGYDNVRIKGVRCTSATQNSDGMAWHVSTAAMTELLKGRKLTANYRSFPTMMEVLGKQKEPCRLISRTRTVQMLTRESLNYQH